MWDMTPRRILVAVESAECDAALEFAAVEARKRHCGVHLIHVNQPAYGGGAAPDPMVIRSGQLQRVGTAVLADAGAKLEHLLIDDDDLTVSTELCHGVVVPTLVAESIHACLVIMQHGGMGPAGDTTVKSTVHGVAARAHVPAVAVPSNWHIDPEAVPVITVGVEDVAITGRVVRVALEEADRCNARLLLAHAYTPMRTGDADLDRVAAEQESRRLGLEVKEAYADLLSRFPEVPSEVMASPGTPAEAMLARAKDSTLLVVGRRQPRLPIVSHLGPIARAILRWSPIPVMIVDPVAPAEAVPPGRDLTSAAIP